jgi:hypothetical protein
MANSCDFDKYICIGQLALVENQVVSIKGTTQNPSRPHESSNEALSERSRPMPIASYKRRESPSDEEHHSEESNEDY